MVGAGSYCITLRHGELTSMYGNPSTLCCKDSAKPCTSLYFLSYSESKWYLQLLPLLLLPGTHYVSGQDIGVTFVKRGSISNLHIGTSLEV